MNANEIIKSLEKGKKFPEFRVGDTVRVHVKIREGEKERIQIFEGLVIKRRRSAGGASFTVRKISYGVGVERIFAFRSPAVDRIEVVQRGKVRRARLFYLRGKKGREFTVEGTLEVAESAEGAEAKKTAPPLKTSSSLAAPVPAS